MTRSRKWVFTLNNYTDEETELVRAFAAHENTRWLIFGKEKGANGTPHLQGALYMRAGKTLRALKAKIGIPRIHLEKMRGTFSQNRAYCVKEGDFEEHGVLPMDPKDKGEMEKERWNEVWSHLENGDDIDELKDNQIKICHYKKLEYISQKLKTKKAKRLQPHELDCQWLWGPPGTGKTRAVWDTYGDDLYVKGGHQWWDHYKGEETVLIDDADPEFVKTHFMQLKQWADLYPFQAQVKGGVLKRIRPRRLIVTSNTSLNDIFMNGGDDEEALLRRFTSYHFTNGPNGIAYP